MIQYLIHLQVSTLSLGLGAIITTIISIQFIALINESGEDSGITAAHNDYFLGMFWTAVILQFLGTTEILIAILRYRAAHCHCDWEQLPSSSPEEAAK